MRRSSSSPRWGRLAGAVASTRPRLRELALDRREDRLAVRVAALVVAHRAQVGARELVEARGDLRGGEVVVLGDREAGAAQPGRPPRAVDLAQHAVARGAARAAEQ